MFDDEGLGEVCRSLNISKAPAATLAFAIVPFHPV